MRRVVPSAYREEDLEAPVLLFEEVELLEIAVKSLSSVIPRVSHKIASVHQRVGKKPGIRISVYSDIEIIQLTPRRSPVSHLRRRKGYESGYLQEDLEA